MFSGLFLWIISWDLHDSHALLGLLPAWGSQCAASVQPVYSHGTEKQQLEKHLGPDFSGQVYN